MFAGASLDENSGAFCELKANFFRLILTKAELVNLNIDDIDFEGRECIVYGKGDKERRVYFDAKAKVHLKEYIDNRTDNNSALFVTLDAPYDRLKSVEWR